jgi:hypothetical protein
MKKLRRELDDLDAGDYQKICSSQSGDGYSEVEGLGFFWVLGQLLSKFLVFLGFESFLSEGFWKII